MSYKIISNQIYKNNERRKNKEMIKIGFDDEVFEEDFDENGDPIIKHGDGYEDRLQEKKLTAYIPERRIKQFLEEYETVVVNEFGDEYHLSEEERIEMNKFYEAFKTFNKCKHKYRKLDEYVAAMREALKCLDFVAENNGFYSPEKFKALFLKGKIYVNGLVFPELKGRERKNISWEYLTEFILSDTDPSEVLPKNKEDVLSEYDDEELINRLFSHNELKEIMREETEEETILNNTYFDVEEDSQDGRNIVVFTTPKQGKKIIKSQPEFLNKVKEIQRENRTTSRLSGLLYDLTCDDIDAISDYDRKHQIVTDSDMPLFKGDLTNSDDYHRYLLELEEWENAHIKENYHGKLKTQEQIQELELKQALERSNWNIRNLYDNKEKEKRLKKIQKKDAKREKEIRKKLTDIKNRRKSRTRRMGDNDIDDYIKDDKKKKKKKSNKSKVKDSKKKLRKTSDDILLISNNRKEDNFKEYQKEIEDFSWDKIMKGN